MFLLKNVQTKIFIHFSLKPLMLTEGGYVGSSGELYPSNFLWTFINLLIFFSTFIDPFSQNLPKITLKTPFPMEFQQLFIFYSNSLNLRWDVEVSMMHREREVNVTENRFSKFYYLILGRQVQLIEFWMSESQLTELELIKLLLIKSCNGSKGYYLKFFVTLEESKKKSQLIKKFLTWPNLILTKPVTSPSPYTIYPIFAQSFLGGTAVQLIILGSRKNIFLISRVFRSVSLSR